MQLVANPRTADHGVSPETADQGENPKAAPINISANTFRKFASVLTQAPLFEGYTSIEYIDSNRR